MSSSACSSTSIYPQPWTVDSLKQYITEKNALIESTESLPTTEDESIPPDEFKASLPDPIPASSSQEESVPPHLCFIEVELKEKLLQEKLRKNFERAKQQQFEEPKKKFFLDSSKTEITTERIEYPGMVAGKASSIGRRPTMEDRSLVGQVHFHAAKELYQADVAGVFDGHGSDEISEFIHGHLITFLQTTLEIYNEEEVTDRGIWKALRASFKWLHRLSPNKEKLHGSTAIVTFIFQQNIWVANAGDCRVVFCPENPVSEEEKCVALSEDASLGNPRFVKRIVEKGGGSITEDATTRQAVDSQGKVRIITRVTKRVNGILGVGSSLGIGEKHLLGTTGKCCISPIPKVIRYPYKEGTLVLASDGLWYRCHSACVPDLIDQIGRTAPPEEIARCFVSSALAANTADNISVVVISLLQPESTIAKRARRS